MNPNFRNIRSPLTNNYSTENSSLASIPISDDIFYKIVNTNISYLGISIAIILGLGALGALLFQFFSLKPQKERIDKQEKEMKEMEIRMTQAFKNQIIKQEEQFTAQRLAINETENRIKDTFREQLQLQEDSFSDVITGLKCEIYKTNTEELDKLKKEINLEIDRLQTKNDTISTLISKINSKANQLQYKLDLADISAEWTSHYLWKLNGVIQNELSCIERAIKKTIKLNPPGDPELYTLSLSEALTDGRIREIDKEVKTDIIETMQEILKDSNFEAIHQLVKNTLKRVNELKESEEE